MSSKKRLGLNLVNQWRNLGLLSVTFGAMLYRVSFTVADPDLWGHLMFGADIWRSGKIIQSDPYSYLTEGQLWINHEWLSELIFYVFYSRFGVIGLVGLKVSICLAALAVVYWRLLRSGMSRVRACILTVWVAVLLVPGVSSVRPHLFTYGLFLQLLLILRRQGQTLTSSSWIIPAIFVLWVNLHGGFLAGLAVLLLHFAVRLFEALRADNPAQALYQQRGNGAVLLLTLLGLLVNPYGWRLLVFLVRPETLVRPEVTEWASLSLMSTYGGFLISLSVFAATSIWLSRRPRDPALLAVLFAVGVAAVMAFRHGPLLAIAIPILAGEHITEVWNRWMPTEVQQKSRFRRGVILAWCLGYTMIMVAGSVRHFRCIRLEPEATGGYPVEAVSRLKRSGAAGKMVVFFNWGEYALWHLSPRIQVSVDGRRETVYSETVYQENLVFASGGEGWDQILRKYGSDLALVSRGYPAFSLMQSLPGWVNVYEDDLCGLFVSKQHNSLKQLMDMKSQRTHAGSQNTCFP